MDNEKYSKEKISEIIVIVMILSVIILGIILIIFDINNSKSEDDMEKENIKTNFEKNQTIVKEYKFKECIKSDNTYDLICNNELASIKARDTMNIEYCQYLKHNEEFLVYECELDLSKKNSIKNENISYCYQTKNENIITECENNFIEILYKDKISSYCKENNVKDNCYNSYILNIESITDSTLENEIKIIDCSKIKGIEERNDCIIYTKNESENKIDLCLEMNSNFFINLCETE